MIGAGSCIFMRRIPRHKRGTHSPTHDLINTHTRLDSMTLVSWHTVWISWREQKRTVSSAMRSAGQRWSGPSCSKGWSSSLSITQKPKRQSERTRVDEIQRLVDTCTDVVYRTIADSEGNKKRPAREEKTRWENQRKKVKNILAMFGQNSLVASSMKRAKQVSL